MPKASKTSKTAPETQKEIISDKERIDKGQILVRIIIEVLGAPKEYVEQAVKLVVDKVHNIKDLDIVSEATYEAEERGEVFSTFSEIEVWFKNLDILTQFLFDFTPSSVEIIQPAKLAFKADFVSGFMNDFLLKMHDLGLKLKDTAAKTQLLQKNTDILVRNFLKVVLQESRSLDEIAKLTGIPKDNAEAMLQNFEKAGLLKKENDSYLFIKK